MANVTGLITVNGKEILEVDASPGGGAGTASPVGSIAMYEDGSNVGHLYIKTGSADTAWSEVDNNGGNDWNTLGNALTGGSPTTPNEWFGSSNDFDVVSKRNNVEIMRMAVTGLLIGLTASSGGRLQVGVATLGDVLTNEISPNGGSGALVTTVTRQYKAFTTTAAPVVLASLAVPAASRMLAEFWVTGSQTAGAGGAVGDGGSYIRTLDLKRLAAGVAIIRKNQTSFTSEDSGAFNVTAAVNVNNVDISVTGDVNRDMTWTSHAKILVVST